MMTTLKPIPRLCLLMLMLLTPTCLQATEPKQRGTAAWSLAVAKEQLKQRLAVVPAPTTKACGCSGQCVCGCNTGEPCRCGSSTTLPASNSGCRVINGVMVCPNK